MRSIWWSNRNLWIVVTGVALVLYALYQHLRIGDELYVFSKSFAPWEVRQYLGMSKRYLLQYGHMVLQFVILVGLPYVLTGELDGKSRVLRIVRWCTKYWLPVFLLHYPALYFVGALIDHDRVRPADQAVLLAGALAVSLLFGRYCYALKPVFDRLAARIRRRLEGIGAGPSRARARSRKADGGVRAYTVGGSFGCALDTIKVVCALAIVLGHFSFQEFVAWTGFGLDGSAPRFAVPAFFMISGYLTMLSLDRSTDGWMMSVFNRYWNLMFVVLPMLFVVPLINRIGFDLDPAIYLAHEGSGVVLLRGTESIFGFMQTVVISMFYLNEIFLFNVTGIDRMLGGVGVFGNAPFWFLCYLMPYVLLLTTLVKARGPMRAFVCSLLILLAGPPILMLSPLFFSGVVAYLLHRRHRNWVASAMNRGPAAERDRVESPAPLWTPAHRGQTST